MNNKSLNDKVLDIIIEEAIEKYAQDIANEEVVCDMTDEEIKRIEQQKNRIYKKTVAKIKHRRISYRKIIILAATLVVLMALALNTSAVRTFLFKTYTDISGTTLYITTTKIDDSRYNIIKEFENKNELIVPGWLPSGMELTEIRDDISSIYLRFESGEKWIRFYQRGIGEGGAVVETENNKFNLTDCKVLGMEGKLLDITSESNIRLYMAAWNSDNVKYELTTNLDINEMENILKNLKYYN